MSLGKREKEKSAEQPIKHAKKAEERPARRPKQTGALFVLCYLVGWFTGRAAEELWRFLYRRLTPVGHFFRRGWRRFVHRPWVMVKWELHRIRFGFRLGLDRVQAARERSLLLAVLQALLLPWIALRRHRRFLHMIAEGVMLAVSVLVLVGVVRYWQNNTFALELEYGGRTIGYIEDEAVFQAAVNMAEGRVIKTTDEFVLQREPNMTLRPVQQSAILDKNALCDEILKLSGGDVQFMSGLYVDGHFEGALPSREMLEELLADILAEYDTEADTAEKTAEFMRPVELVDGLYPLESEVMREALFARLTAPDEDGLPYLGVQIRCTEVYSEPIPFEKKTVKDGSKYIGYTAIRTQGVEGERRITADVIYVNGVEIRREITNEEVVRSPVTQVTAVGSYRVNADASAGVATGEFLWPVPYCHNITSPFGGRGGRLHKGIDINRNGIYGKDILAADGGRVAQVNTSGPGGGYGLYVLIDHGNGYTTMYAHCSEILVKKGDKVTQGQLIARVGDTGQSTAPHLHFEIRINGTAVNPVPYVQ